MQYARFDPPPHVTVRVRPTFDGRSPKFYNHWCSGFIKSRACMASILIGTGGFLDQSTVLSPFDRLQVKEGVYNLLCILCHLKSFKGLRDRKREISAPSASSHSSPPSATLGHSGTNIYCPLVPLARLQMAHRNFCGPYTVSTNGPLAKLWVHYGPLCSFKKISFSDFNPSFYFVFPHCATIIRVIIPRA